MQEAINDAWDELRTKKTPHLFCDSEDRRRMDAAAGESRILRQELVGARQRSRRVAGIERDAGGFDERIEQIARRAHAHLLGEMYQEHRRVFMAQSAA